MLSVNFVIFIFVISFITVNVSSEGEVPLLIWGTGLDLIKYKPSALNKLSAGEFYEHYLKDLVLYSPPVITVFVEESLSIEDFRWRDFNNENAYSALQHVAKTENMKFVPYVNDPLKALKKLKNDDYKVRIYEKGIQKEDELVLRTENVYNDTNNVIIINLFDAQYNEDRPNLLKRHDKYINAICKQMQEKYGNVVCMLTANQPSWIEPDTMPLLRKLLSTTGGNDTELNLYFYKNFGMVYTKSPPILSNKTSNTSTKLIFNKNVPITLDKSSMRVTFLGNGSELIKVIFNFVVSGNIWKLQNVGIEEGQQKYLLTTNSKVGTSSGFSFHTPVPVSFSDDTMSLTFSNLQAELFFGKDITSFSVADDTVPFFTIPILSGLLVSSLLLAIVLIGLSMICDIKTMDQFDDPKGKTITINVSE